MRLAAAPPTITSCPPPPSIVSEAEPPVIVLAAPEPRIVMVVETELALTFRNSLIVVDPDMSWLDAARLRLTPASRTSVLLTPEPPSIEFSDP